MMLVNACCAALFAADSLTLPEIFGDNMMLQQQTDAKIWGWAKPGTMVQVTTSWDRQKQTATAGNDGKWTIRIRTPKASYVQQSVTIKAGNETIECRNVLIGEVWFCSGQSNMEMPLAGFWNCPVEGANEAIAQSGRYRHAIRVATVEKNDPLTPAQVAKGKWETCEPANAGRFSACGYFFATALNDVLDVPVGIINCSWGGSCVEGWMPREILETYPDGLTPITETDYHRKMVMYNGMLYPLAGYTIKGFLWNQGESNVGRENEYRERFATMTRLWRKMWDQPNDKLPIYTVELPSFRNGDADGDWAPKFREMQHTIAHELENCGCVCTADLIYDYELDQIHGAKKKEIGQRLAYMALTRDYDVKGIVADAPEFEYAERHEATDADVQVIAGTAMAKNENDKGIVYHLYFANSYDGFDRQTGIEGFEAQAADGTWHKATVWSDSAWKDVKRQGCFLKLLCPEIGEVKAIRYAFHNFCPAKLHNLRGLPVVPFGPKTVGNNGMVTVKDGRFYLDGKEYRYVGTNMWYGAILGSEGQGGNRQRLLKELDDMKAVGIDNVRVLIGGDGRDGIPSHIAPKLQSEPGVYNDTILAGLDFLMAELEKRDMKAVLYFNNAWEWSGGYGAYLDWVGFKGDVESSDGSGKKKHFDLTPVPSIDGWWEYMQYVGNFILNDEAKKLAANHVRNMVTRINRYTGKPYTESKALMAWEIANEPRCFVNDKLHKDKFVEWIDEQSTLIKELDPNHLVTTGSEGQHGCEDDWDLFRRIHELKNIDYACIHIWPNNWGWLGKFNQNYDADKTVVGDDPIVLRVDTACANTLDYINRSYDIMNKIGRPVVLEEFGYPRDRFLFTPGSPTVGRDAYYKYVFSIIRDSGKIAGCNFWGWGGHANVKHTIWQRWDDYVCDPAQEEQGLNSVFAVDKSTMDVIKEMTKQIKR